MREAASGDETIVLGNGYGGFVTLQMAIRHPGVGNRLAGFGHALNQTRVLVWKEALGNEHIEEGGEHQGPERDPQRQSLMIEHPGEPLPIPVNHGGKPLSRFRLRGLVLRPMLQELSAHHGHQGQRDDGGDQNRHRQRDGEFAEQSADDVLHEQQRNQDGDERHGE